MRSPLCPEMSVYLTPLFARAFYRLRIEASHVLAKLATREAQWTGLVRSSPPSACSLFLPNHYDIAAFIRVERSITNDTLGSSCACFQDHVLRRRGNSGEAERLVSAAPAEIFCADGRESPGRS
jgi:hypothetical protein